MSNTIKRLLCADAALILLGAIFRICHWPGGTFIFLTACALGIILLLYTAIFHKFDK